MDKSPLRKNKSGYLTPISRRKTKYKQKTPRINLNLVIEKKKDKFFDKEFKGNLDKVMCEAYQIIQKRREKIGELEQEQLNKEEEIFAGRLENERILQEIK